MVSGAPPNRVIGDHGLIRLMMDVLLNGPLGETRTVMTQVLARGLPGMRSRTTIGRSGKWMRTYVRGATVQRRALTRRRTSANSGSTLSIRPNIVRALGRSPVRS